MIRAREKKERCQIRGGQLGTRAHFRQVHPRGIGLLHCLLLKSRLNNGEGLWFSAMICIFRSEPLAIAYWVTNFLSYYLALNIFPSTQTDSDINSNNRSIGIGKRH